jgi:hydroxyethylthiazole kinase-like uncharacterized protein yjeF
MTTLTQTYIASFLKSRNADSHKGTYGHALLVAGRSGSMGAAVIAARACLRTGAGLLTVQVPKKERVILQATIPEAMLAFRKEKTDFSKFSAAGIGPAIGTDKQAAKLLKGLLTDFKKPVLLDADALTLLSKDASLWKLVAPDSILTPHPKEFDRIAGASSSPEERKERAIAFAQEKNIVLVLKGHETLITQAGESFVNSTGNAGLAKGGSGDMLTGMITALLAQGYAPLYAACAGVYLHGLAADLTLQQQSMESMLATDVIENIGKAFAALK